MKLKLNRLFVVILATFGLLGLTGCKTDWYTKTTSNLARNPQATWEIMNGVNEMYRLRRMDTNTVDVQGNNVEFPPRYWSAPIAALHPIKVYVDVSNIVVAQKIVNGVEYGKYIQPPVSSHMAQVKDGFICTSIDVSFVYNYQRNLKP